MEDYSKKMNKIASLGAAIGRTVIRTIIKSEECPSDFSTGEWMATIWVASKVMTAAMEDLISITVGAETMELLKRDLVIISPHEVEKFNKDTN